MLTKDEQINRRLGRLEDLATDLSQVKPGYQPTELEILRAAALHAALGEFLGVAPEAEPGPKKAKPGKK